MTPAGIEPATFRFVVQHLNHCSNAAEERDHLEVIGGDGKMILKLMLTKCNVNCELISNGYNKKQGFFVDWVQLVTKDFCLLVG